METMKKRLLYVFLASLLYPFFNKRIWEASGAEFWVGYGIIFTFAFLLFTMMFVLPLKEENKKESDIKTIENEQRKKRFT